MQLLWSVPLFEQPSPPFSPDGRQPAQLIVAFSFVLELDAVFVACSSGELLLLYTASHAVEEVGVVAGGLAAAAWSPDGELLALMGYNQLLLMMNKVGGSSCCLATALLLFSCSPAAATTP